MSRGRTAVWVGAEEARRGSIPTRCARTGERCITRVLLESSEVHPTLEWATWSGLWPRSRGRQPAGAIVSLLPRVARLRTGLRRTRDVTAALLPVLVLLALLTGGWPQRISLWALLATAVVKVLVALLGPVLTVGVRTDHTRSWVLLSRVHPEMAAATESATTRPDAEPSLEAPVEARDAAAGGPGPEVDHPGTGPDGAGAGARAGDGVDVGGQRASSAG